MKKIVSVFLLVALAVSLCACGKTATTCENFVSVMEQAGYTVEEMTDGPEGSKGYAAYNDDQSFVLYFYEMGQDRYAVNAYNYDRNNFETMSGSSTYVSAGNYGCATKTSGGMFYMSAFIGSTYLYGECGSDQADTMKDLFKTLGYK